jgi:PiT family inorganic phosphate transporter
MSDLLVPVITILFAFTFAFTNGFQDASSVAATFIASRSASPRQGILFVAGMDFIGAILGGSAVALTISGLLVLSPDENLVLVILVALVAAAAWNMAAWHYGLPSSSTHALIGGLVGAGIAAAGLESVAWGVAELAASPHQLTGLVKILVFLVFSVIIGFLSGYLMRKTTRILLRNSKRSVNRDLVRINWLAAGIMGFSNGANDGQKQMGVIALVLFAAGLSATTEVPLWARIGCAVMLTAGTLGGGWRIMATLGRRIFRIDPIHSFDSQLSSGATIALSTIAGAPISSTHVITTSILGVGAAENPLKVRWPVGIEIMITMLVTIPVTLGIAAFLYMVTSSLIGG